ncbi:MAG: hypothetical protein ACW97Z_02690 [Candidatus Hodarchaeales archaeon]|jgi:hypothetical protein
MLKLIPLGEPIPVPFETMPGKLEFKSPTSDFSLVFHSVEEIRMAQYVWKISIFEGEVEITDVHSFEDQYFFLPIYYSSFIRSYYAPWGYKGEILCLYFVTEELDIITKFYSLSTKSFVSPPLPNTTTVLCSTMSSDVLTISYDPQTSAWSPFIVNLDGTIKFRLPYSGIPLDLFISWINPLPNYFVIFYDPEEKKTTLNYYEGVSETLKKKIPLEPSQLVPFKEEVFISDEIDRSSPSALKSLAYGDFLNKWDEIGFDKSSNTIRLRFVRPSSQSFAEEGQEYVNIQKFEVQYRIEVTKE